MLTIAGGIVLGFFAIIFILIFGKSILEFIGAILLVALFVAGLGLSFYLISLIPYAKEVFGWLLVVVILGGLALGALVWLYAGAKLLFDRVGVLYGALVVGGLVAAPPVISYLIIQPELGAEMEPWGLLTFWLTLSLPVLVVLSFQAKQWFERVGIAFGLLTAGGLFGASAVYLYDLFGFFFVSVSFGAELSAWHILVAVVAFFIFAALLEVLVGSVIDHFQDRPFSR